MFKILWTKTFKKFFKISFKKFRNFETKQFLDVNNFENLFISIPKCMLLNSKGLGLVVTQDRRLNINHYKIRLLLSND